MQNSLQPAFMLTSLPSSLQGTARSVRSLGCRAQALGFRVPRTPAKLAAQFCPTQSHRPGTCQQTLQTRGPSADVLHHTIFYHVLLYYDIVYVLYMQHSCILWCSKFRAPGLHIHEHMLARCVSDVTDGDDGAVRERLCPGTEARIPIRYDDGIL